MNDYSKYVIKNTATVIDALKKLNGVPLMLTLFVVDEANRVVGTLTDGDIRRCLINGNSTSSSIEKVYFRNFHFIEQEKNNFDKLKIFRQKKLKAIPLLDKNMSLVKIIDFTTAKSILPVDAVIMAGGIGNRLKPLTNDTPKPLLKVGGKEIIAYNFDRLFQFGITRQYVSINYLGEQIEKFCNDYNENISFRIINETDYLGTAGALSLIDDFHNDTVLLMNSDILTNIDYEDFYISFLSKNADIMVASIPYDVNLPYAIFNTNESHVLSLKEKPSYTYYANAGIYLFKKEILQMVPKNKYYDATDLMNEAVKKGFKLLHYPIRNYWLDIGKHEDYEKAQRDIAHINFD